jgi:mannose-6-phosphate isomerase
MTNAPIFLEPALNVRVWGGRQLESRLGKPLPTAEPYGESWEIFWKNRVAGGQQTLGELIAADPHGMTGIGTAGAEFPLLVKFLDAQDWLSVQVHPDDAQAAQLEGEPRGKTECWYVVDAAPGAQLIYGLKGVTSADQYRRMVAEGRTREALQFVDVQAGDFIFVPAGTQHAIGPGLLIYELQQTSDTTYRVWDWDRVGLDGKPRPLHLEKALAVTHYGDQPPAKTPYTFHPQPYGESARLVRGPFFNLDLLRLNGTYTADLRQSETVGGPALRAHLITVIKGALRLEGDFPAASLPLGISVFVPAGVGRYTLSGTGEALIAWGA